MSSRRILQWVIFFLLVSAGFDAAEGDPIGDCNLTPFGYAQMTMLLKTVSEGKLMIVLEGGYNLEVISEASVACMTALLGEEINGFPKKMVVSEKAAQVVEEVIRSHSQYWKCLYPKHFDEKFKNSPTSANFQGKLLIILIYSSHFGSRKCALWAYCHRNFLTTTHAFI